MGITRTDAQHIDRLTVSNVTHDSQTGCKLWNGLKSADGYAHVRRENIMFLVHRLAWTLLVGPIPKGKFVLHKCDVRHCVEVSHLFIGTHEDNMRDMVNKGRQHHGETASNAKLTSAMVARIRAMYPTGKYTYASLGARFGVTSSAISNIINHVTYREAA